MTEISRCTYGPHLIFRVLEECSRILNDAKSKGMRALGLDNRHRPMRVDLFQGRDAIPGCKPMVCSHHNHPQTRIFFVVLQFKLDSQTLPGYRSIEQALEQIPLGLKPGYLR